MVAEDAQAEPAQAQQGGLAEVGVKLAEAREQRQLSLEAVAGDLHLRPEVVRALETADQPHLPSPPFVRGYIKSYARLLGLDEAALLAQLPRVSEHNPVPLKRVGMRPPKTVSVARGRFLAWGLILFSVTVVGLYGVPALQRLWTARTAEPASDELLIPLPGYGDETPAADVPEPELSEELSESESAAGIGLQPPDSEPVAVEELVEGEPALPAADAEPPLEEAEPAVAGPQQAAAEAAGPAVVQLRFVEDSWVEMEANGRKLVVGTQRAGTERTVRVEPPVHLLLGNAPGVEVLFRGRPVDLGSHQRGKVARVTLED